MRILKMALSAIGLSLSLFVSAQTNPNQQLKLIIPFAACGPSDSSPRDLVKTWLKLSDNHSLMKISKLPAQI